jgi:hypothetical protein
MLGLLPKTIAPPEIFWEKVALAFGGRGWGYGE